MCDSRIRERNRERDYASSRGGVGLESVYRLVKEGSVTEFEVTGFARSAPMRMAEGCLDAPDFLPAGCCEWNTRPMQSVLLRGWR